MNPELFCGAGIVKRVRRMLSLVKTRARRMERAKCVIGRQVML